MTDKLDARVEIWKKIVDVQQHFNDLELRIRNFALIVTGAFLGLGGYAIKDGGYATVVGSQIPSAALIVGASLLPLLAFYVMDRLWYHRLLDGSVKAGAKAEEALANLGAIVHLGSEISKASPFTLPLFKMKVHSRHKMDGFYGILALAIAVLAMTIACAVNPAPTQTILATAVRQAEVLDDDAARAVCESYVSKLLAGAASTPGSLVLDSKTGRQAVLVAGRWRLVPKCS